MLVDLGISSIPNNAELFAAFARCRNGENLRRFAITAQSALINLKTDHPYTIIVNRPRKEIAVWVSRPECLLETKHLAHVHQLTEQTVARLEEKTEKYYVFKQELSTALKNAASGAEALGVELPLILAAAVGTTPLHANLALKHTKDELFKSSSPRERPFHIKVSKDKMLASIAHFDMHIYDDPIIEPTLTWISDQLKQNKITAPMSKDIALRLEQALELRSNLDGLICSRGILPEQHQGPYLKSYAPDVANRTDNILEPSYNRLNLRDIQPTQIVRAGDLIAEIRYEHTAEPGYDVYGNILLPRAQEILPVTLGEGIERRDNKFYALCDGIPQVGSKNIQLEKLLIHAGDVNLRSGDIRYDGSVEIKGSIDTGATVETTGDLIVHGQILSATVRVRGNLKVYSGIVTGPNNSVDVRGNIAAEFIEHSEIICHQNLTVQRAILNTHAYIGGQLKILSPEGVCAGGSINCRGDIICQDIGFKYGNHTNIRVGIDWRTVRSINILNMRNQRLQEILNAQVVELNAIKLRTTFLKNQEAQDLISQLSQKNTRCRRILDHLKARILTKHQSLAFNSKSRIYVYGMIHTTLNVEIGGSRLTVPAEMNRVCLLKANRRQAFITPLENLELIDQS